MTTTPQLERHLKLLKRPEGPRFGWLAVCVTLLVIVGAVIAAAWRL